MTGFRCFRYDDDDSVSSPRTVNRCCRSIFQDIDRSNLFVIIVHQFLQRNLKTVHNNQRSIQLIAYSFVEFFHTHRQRRISTHIHLRQSIRVTTDRIIHKDIDRRIDIFQGTDQVLPLISDQIIRLNSRHRPGITFPCFIEHPGHHHFFHLLGIFCQYNFKIGFPFQGYLLVFIPDKSNFNLSNLRRNIQLKLPIEIGRSSDQGFHSRSLYRFHRSSGQYFSLLIDNKPGNRSHFLSLQL